MKKTDSKNVVKVKIYFKKKKLKLKIKNYKLKIIFKINKSI
jgi:hypothetical protein